MTRAGVVEGHAFTRARPPLIFVCSIAGGDDAVLFGARPLGPACSLRRRRNRRPWATLACVLRRTNPRAALKPLYCLADLPRAPTPRNGRPKLQ
jgi:hypothetical protein